jgi:hypothetical protein
MPHHWPRGRLIVPLGYLARCDVPRDFEIHRAALTDQMRDGTESAENKSMSPTALTGISPEADILWQAISLNSETDLEVLAAVRSPAVFSAQRGRASDEIPAWHSLPKEEPPTHGSNRGPLSAARFCVIVMEKQAASRVVWVESLGLESSIDQASDQILKCAR